MFQWWTKNRYSVPRVYRTTSKAFSMHNAEKLRNSKNCTLQKNQLKKKRIRIKRGRLLWSDFLFEPFVGLRNLFSPSGVHTSFQFSSFNSCLAPQSLPIKSTKEERGHFCSFHPGCSIFLQGYGILKPASDSFRPPHCWKSVLRINPSFTCRSTHPCKLNGANPQSAFLPLKHS